MFLFISHRTLGPDHEIPCRNRTNLKFLGNFSERVKGLLQKFVIICVIMLDSIPISEAHYRKKLK